MSDRCQACGLGWLTNFLCLKFVRGLRAHKPSTQPFSRAWVALIRAWHETRMALSDLQEGNSYELGGNRKEGPGTGKFFGKAAGLYVLLSTSSKNWEAPRCVFRARCCLNHCSNSPPRPSDAHLSLTIEVRIRLDKFTPSHQRPTRCRTTSSDFSFTPQASRPQLPVEDSPFVTASTLTIPSSTNLASRRNLARRWQDYSTLKGLPPSGPPSGRWHDG